MKYFARIRFVGSNFCGFQVQPNARTVQGELTSAAAALFGVPCAITGCSRTDSGVHAHRFYVTIAPAEGAAQIPPDRLPLALQPFLPADLALCEAVEAPADFHARYGVVEKEYMYLMRTSPVSDPFWVGRAWTFPRPLPPDALPRMQEAALSLCGKHDFSSFMAAGSKIVDAVRTVRSFRIEREGEMIRFFVSADGFLYNMVRIFVGTLIDVAEHRFDPADMPAILAARSRDAAGATAPPEGLYLNRVFYALPLLPETVLPG